MTPSDLWREAAADHARAVATEARAIRLALAETGHRVQPAAAILGIPHTTLVRLLDGRHREIGREIRDLRERLRAASQSTRVRKPLRNGEGSTPARGSGQKPPRKGNAGAKVVAR